MSPIGQTKYESKEFPIPYIVVSFGRIEGFGGISYCTTLAPFILLKKDCSYCICRGVCLEFEGFIAIWGNENWILGDLLNEGIEFGSAFLCPDKFDPFLGLILSGFGRSGRGLYI